MRKLRYGRFFILGFLILFGLQLAGLIYAEKVYFAGAGRYSSKLMDLDKAVKLKRNLRLDPAAEGMKLSYNGVYMAYTKDGLLHSVNLETGKIEQIDSEEGQIIGFYQWIYDRNRLVIVERKADPKANDPFRLYYYDTTSASKEAIYNGVGDKVLVLPGHSKDEAVTGMDLSTLTNMMYFKLTQGNGSSRIYQANIMAQYERTDTATSRIGAIAAIKSTDDFFYENQSTSRVHEENRGKIQVDGKTKLRLLGIDGSDQVYVGDDEQEQGLVARIYVLQIGEAKKGRSRPAYEKVCQIELPVPSLREDIFVTGKGFLCVRHPQQHTLDLYAHEENENAIGTSEQGSAAKASSSTTLSNPFATIPYEGDRLFFYNKGFLSLDAQCQLRNYSYRP